MIRIGLVAPLPPTPAGAAEYVAAQLPYLEAHAEVTCFVPDPTAVSPEVVKAHRVRPLADRFDADIDVLIYHLGNNPHHGFVYDAVLEGPPGIVEIHDASMHHYSQDRVLGKNRDAFGYAALGQQAHGWSGRRLAQLRSLRFRGVSELFVMDYLRPMLDQSIGAIVHSEYAGKLVQHHRPDLPRWVVPLHSIPPEHIDTDEDREWTGVRKDKLLIANLGFVTAPKRPFTSLEAFKIARDRGLDAHLVFAGKDETHGELKNRVATMGLSEHVTITGYLDSEDLRRWTNAVDVVVNLRAPHVGESSAALTASFAAAKPVIVQPIGSWAEMPEDVVVRIPVTDDDATVLASTFFSLGQNEEQRNTIGLRAQRYARETLAPHHVAELLADAARDAAKTSTVPDSWRNAERGIVARRFLDSGITRYREVADDDAALLFEVLTTMAPSTTGQALLAIDVPHSIVQVLHHIWGFEIEARTTGKAATVRLDEVGNVPALDLEVSKLHESDLTDARWPVIITGKIIGDLGEFLRTCNRALEPQGQLVLVGHFPDEEALDAGGFSSHVRLDNPAWSRDFRCNFQHLTHGVKATLPIGI